MDNCLLNNLVDRPLPSFSLCRAALPFPFGFSAVTWDFFFWSTVFPGNPSCDLFLFGTLPLQRVRDDLEISPDLAVAVGALQSNRCCWIQRGQRYQHYRV